jgi:histidine triad (HIT) family protein
MIYDKENIFAKILRKEIPCETVFENDFILAFKDINSQAKTHILSMSTFVTLIIALL